MHIVLTPDKDVIVGEYPVDSGVRVNSLLEKLNHQLEELSPHDVIYSRIAGQLHINIPFEGDLIHSSFVYARNHNKTLIRMNIQADKPKTLDKIIKIFDEITPF